MMGKSSLSVEQTLQIFVCMCVLRQHNNAVQYFNIFSSVLQVTENMFSS